VIYKISFVYSLGFVTTVNTSSLSTSFSQVNNMETSWLDFITPLEATTSKQEVYSCASGFENDKSVQRTVEILNGPTEYTTLGGRTFTRHLDYGRHYVLHIPEQLIDKQNSSEHVPLVVFYHGAWSRSWQYILHHTGWVNMANKHGFIVAFGQAKIRHSYTSISRSSGLGREQGVVVTGEIFWDVCFPEDDLKYTEMLLKDVIEYTGIIDERKVFYMGNSSGGLFCTNVAVYFGGTKFAAFCNSVGGIDEREGSLKVADQTHDKPVPMMIITGTKDTHYEMCLNAQDMFQEAGWPVTLVVLENWYHKYPKHLEEEIFAFFMRSVE
jgi:hypothetical protein